MTSLHTLKIDLRFTLYAFFLIALRSLSQDTIHFVSREVKVVKVEEVGLSDIKYHRFENVSGPIYISAKTEIDYIVYANGQVEKMKNAPASSPASGSSSTPAFTAVTVNSNNNQFAPRVTVRGGKLFHNGSRISDNEFGDLIDRYPKPDVKLRLENEYTLLTKYKRNSVIWKVVVFAGGIGAPVVGTVLYVGSLGATTPGIGLLTSIVTGTTGCILTKMYKNKHKAKAREMADIYNSGN